MHEEIGQVRQSGWASGDPRRRRPLSFESYDQSDLRQRPVQTGERLFRREEQLTTVEMDAATVQGHVATSATDQRVALPAALAGAAIGYEN